MRLWGTFQMPTLTAPDLLLAVLLGGWRISLSRKLGESMN
jgi:hypothetical protein